MTAYCGILLASLFTLSNSFSPQLKEILPPTSALFAQNRRSFLGDTAVASSISNLLLRPANAATPSGNPFDEDAQSIEPRIALWGYGNQNQLMAKYLADRKLNVVSVIGHHNIGEDYGMVESPWGNIGKETGVKVVDENDAPREFAKTRPNVCLMCTRSTINDLKNSLTTCAKLKCNVITIAEELLDARTSSPKLAKEMDQLFKQEEVSLTGSGFIDGACCEMTMVLASMMQRIDILEGYLQYNVDDYGTVLANAHGVGLTKKEFGNFARRSTDKSYVYNSNEWFVSALGLTLDRTTEVREPTFATAPLFSKSIDKVIPAGDVTGMTVVATTTTKEGVTIVGKQIGKCYEETDSDSVQWAFEGEPSGVSFRMDSPPTPQMTNTAAISRIPMILKAPPGYITSDKLGFGKYHMV